MNFTNLQVIKDWDSIWSESFQNKWMRIMDESPDAHVFFHPAIVKAWVETYVPLRRLEPLFVYGKDPDTDTEVVFPLVRWKQNWKSAFRKLIVPMGYSDFDYHDPIFSKTVSPEHVQCFYEALIPLLSDYDEIVLDGLHKEYVPSGFEVLSESACPYLNLNKYPDPDCFLSSLPKDIRKSYLRREKRITEKYELSYVRYDSQEDCSGLEPIIDQMLQFHVQRWPNAYKAPKFHENLIKQGLENELLLLHTIKTKDQIVSWQISFLYKKVMMLYMPTMNPAFYTYSPGMLSMMYCVEDAISRKYHALDHLRGEENYKKYWASGEVIIYNCRLHNTGGLSSLKKNILKLK